jgi:hypothetical protein
MEAVLPSFSLAWEPPAAESGSTPPERPILLIANASSEAEKLSLASEKRPLINPAVSPCNQRSVVMRTRSSTH